MIISAADLFMLELPRSGDTPPTTSPFILGFGSLQRLVRTETECSRRTACRAHGMQLSSEKSSLLEWKSEVFQRFSNYNAILAREKKQLFIFGYAKDRYRVYSF